MASGLGPVLDTVLFLCLFHGRELASESNIVEDSNASPVSCVVIGIVTGMVTGMVVGEEDTLVWLAGNKDLLVGSVPDVVYAVVSCGKPCFGKSFRASFQILLVSLLLSADLSHPLLKIFFALLSRFSLLTPFPVWSSRR